MKAILETEHRPPSPGDASSVSSQREDEDQERVSSGIPDLDPLIEGCFPAPESHLTGEPGLVKDRDVVGAESPRYLSSHILGRLL